MDTKTIVVCSVMVGINMTTDNNNSLRYAKCDCYQWHQAMNMHCLCGCHNIKGIDY